MNLQLIRSHLPHLDFEPDKLVCITGTRPPKDKSRRALYDRFIETIRVSIEQLFNQGYAIIAGGANGVDLVCLNSYEALGGEYLCLVPFPTKRTDHLKQERVAHLFPRYKGNWQFHRRNEAMVDMCDEVLGFWDGKSSGTKGTLEYAYKQGRYIEIHYMDGTVKAFENRDKKGTTPRLIK